MILPQHSSTGQNNWDARHNWQETAQDAQNDQTKPSNISDGFCHYLDFRADPTLCLTDVRDGFHHRGVGQECYPDAECP